MLELQVECVENPQHPARGPYREAVWEGAKKPPSQCQTESPARGVLRTNPKQKGGAHEPAHETDQ